MLAQRIVTAFGLLFALLAAVFYLPASGWSVFCALLAALAAWEWGQFAGWRRRGRVVYAVVPALSVLVLAPSGNVVGWFAEATLTSWLPLLFVFNVLCWLLPVPFIMRAPRTLPPLLVALLGWLVLVPTALAMISLHAVGWQVLFFALGLVWMADIGAYFVGRRFGKHKLAPAISPGKTREGALGALLCVLLYSVIVALLALPLPAAFLWLSPIGVLLSIEGDLFESWLKRQVGIKDSGQILPGHGGILDRIDGLLAVLPAAAWLLWAVG